MRKSTFRERPLDNVDTLRHELVRLRKSGSRSVSAWPPGPVHIYIAGTKTRYTYTDHGSGDWRVALAGSH